MTLCPTCNLPLRLVVELKVDIDVCDKCHGVWLDAGELDRLSDSTDFADRDFAAGELLDMNCPQCFEKEFVTIKTDVGSFAKCSKCGGVFVGGETLDCIAKFDRSPLSRRPTAETTAMPPEIISGLIELLWFFAHL
jgi:Zn-finger nucleic acid-binding protein